MLEIKIQKSILLDLIKKCAVPTGKDGFMFPTIAPLITPDGKLEWIGKVMNTVLYIRARNITVSGITEPIRLPIEAFEWIGTLSFFKEKDLVSIKHDDAGGKDVFTTVGDETRRKTTSVPSVVIAKAGTLLDKFPGTLDQDGVILFRGNVRPNLYSKCDASFLQDLVTNTNTILGSGKAGGAPVIYNIVFDGDHKCLKTVAGDETDRAHRVLEDESYTDDITGNGAVHYQRGFADIMAVLGGEIHIYALDKGPLWVSQHGDNISAKYMIPPANVGKE
jgi:hypothetical protein